MEKIQSQRVHFLKKSFAMLMDIKHESSVYENEIRWWCVYFGYELWNEISN